MTAPTGVTGPRTPADLLDAALRADPARPLLTFYDDTTGERTELSVATFANWVAKSANLLRDDLDAQPGSTLALALPVHWQAAVVLQGAWALGLEVLMAAPDATPPRADITVTSYDAVDAGLVASPGGELVVLGLGPLGLARADRLPPPGADLDFDREVHAHGDRFAPGSAPDPGLAALRTPDRAYSAGDLTGLAKAQRSVPAGRRLLVAEPLGTLPAVLGGLLVPLAAGVTAVLCRHLDPTRLHGPGGRIRQEDVVASVTSLGASLPPGSPDLPRWVPDVG
ncbi:MAG TPA: TIGR03089 family protein [Actinomycetes bacterium]|nr:TIGR03089 family protein [Actinomycetes bacterium]